MGAAPDPGDNGSGNGMQEDEVIDARPIEELMERNDDYDPTRDPEILQLTRDLNAMGHALRNMPSLQEATGYLGARLLVLTSRQKALAVRVSRLEHVVLGLYERAHGEVTAEEEVTEESPVKQLVIPTFNPRKPERANDDSSTESGS